MWALSGLIKVMKGSLLTHTSSSWMQYPHTNVWYEQSIIQSHENTRSWPQELRTENERLAEFEKQQEQEDRNGAEIRLLFTFKVCLYVL